MACLITFDHEGKSRSEESRSVFIGSAACVSSEKEATDFVSSVREKYPDARHVCYAWRVRTDVIMQKYSDDGEPSGTAGMPILNILLRKEIDNAVITVTRYFGGILLGKGGLARAYTEAASEASLDAGLVKIEDGISYSIRTGYDLSEKILYALRQKQWEIHNLSYAEEVSFDAVCPLEREDEFLSFITDQSSGRVTPVRNGKYELRTKLT